MRCKYVKLHVHTGEGIGVVSMLFEFISVSNLEISQNKVSLNERFGKITPLNIVVGVCFGLWDWISFFIWVDLIFIFWDSNKVSVSGMFNGVIAGRGCDGK